jgi:hypothetical protein
MFVSPSMHRDGYPYEILDCKEPVLCDEFEYHLNNIFEKFGISYLDSNNYNQDNATLIPIDELFKPDTIILQGQNRHEAVLRISESLIQRNKKILSLDKIKDLAYEWNQQHCKPPLDDKEFERQWNDALKFVSRSKSESSNNNSGGNNEETNLVEIARQNCIELFVDQYNVPYANIKINEHIEVLSLNGKRFKNLLSRICYNHTKKISCEKIESITTILKADAEITGNIKHLDLRVGKIDDYTFFYDLTNSKWSVIKITPSGWSIIDNDVPLMFKRYSQQPQVNPSLLYNTDIFDKFMDLVNVQDEDTKLLLKCYIISLFIPNIAKPILIIHGEQGSAKTTLQELIKILVDPSIVKTLAFPRNINELIQQLSHNYITYFDNISIIKEWISDVLCRAVKGSGFSKRQLYTDDDDIIFYFRRCIGLNGINIGATKPDLLDRSIIVLLERISKEKRKKDEEIWKKFNEIKSELLGYILDIIVKFLNFKKQQGSISLPNGFNRMADWEECAEIISRCMGYREGEFLSVYQKNINIQVDEAIAASPLSMAIVELIDNKEEWIGTATDLSLELTEIAETKLKINIQRILSWPKSPNQLSRRLNEIKTNLREKGIEITKEKDKKGNRKIKICKVSSKSSYRQEFEKQEQNPNKSLDDTLDNTNKVSSNNNNKNQEQNNSFGRVDGFDDDLHIKVKEHLSRGKTLKCHHKNCNNKEYLSINDYNTHCHSSHPKQPMYPELSLIKMLGLEAKGNPWE